MLAGNSGISGRETHLADMNGLSFDTLCLPADKGIRALEAVAICSQREVAAHNAGMTWVNQRCWLSESSPADLSIPFLIGSLIFGERTETWSVVSHQ